MAVTEIKAGEIIHNIGDIVECDYGIHPTGETSGFRHAIICDIDDAGRVFAVPVIRNFLEYDSKRFLPFQKDEDAIYTVPNVNGGTALIDEGKRIVPQRIIRVVGFCLPQFLNKLLNALPGAVYFYADKEEQEDFDISDFEFEDLPDLDDNL